MKDLFITIHAIILIEFRMVFVFEKLAVGKVFIRVLPLPRFAIIPPIHTVSFI